MYEEWAKSSSLLSYENNQEYFKANGYGNVPQNDDMEGLRALDVEHDYLASFYIEYLPNLDGEFNQPSYGMLSPEEYYRKASVEKNRLLSYIKDYEEIVKTHKHPLIFGIRPEDIYEISEVTHKVKPSIPFETKVVVAELTGNQYYVHSTLSEEEIVFTSFPDRPIEVNQKMKVVVNLNKFHLFDFVTGNNIIN